jgi:hypothetical protein
LTRKLVEVAKRVLGLRWMEVNDKPQTGIEIRHKGLSDALKKRTEFSKDELDKFKVDGLSLDRHSNPVHQGGRHSFYSSNGPPIICLRWKLTGICQEVMDLHHFSFDVQKLVIRLESGWPMDDEKWRDPGAELE